MQPVAGVPYLKKTSDGFINLRSGPGVKHSIVGKVIQSDVLLIDTGQCHETFGRMHCNRSGKWVFVESIYKLHGEATTQQGWISSRYVRQIACMEWMTKQVCRLVRLLSIAK